MLQMKIFHTLTQTARSVFLQHRLSRLLLVCGGFPPVWHAQICLLFQIMMPDPNHRTRQSCFCTTQLYSYLNKQILEGLSKLFVCRAHIQSPKHPVLFQHFMAGRGLGPPPEASPCCSSPMAGHRDLGVLGCHPSPSEEPSRAGGAAQGYSQHIFMMMSKISHS